LAAAISQELLGEIRSTCEQAGLELKHLVLRPCAAAALLKRHQPAAGQVRMFVDLLGEEVDLTVLDQDTPLLMRTTRLPGDASQPEYCRPVFLEIRRTIAAVQNKLHGRRVEKIWLCGDGPSHGDGHKRAGLAHGAVRSVHGFRASRRNAAAVARAS
jgi:hypothetical protein